MRSQALTDATLLVRQADVGVISTLSQNLKGYPFGSVSPFISDSQGKVYFFISDIAQHAKNLSKDGKMSFTVFNRGESGDQNTQGRVTIVGDGAPVDEELQEQMLARYVTRFPDAESYKRAHDFKMWQLDIKRVRYIGGFGKIFWLEKEEWDRPAAPWDFVAEQGMIKHMNEDHQDAMSLILAEHHGIQDENPVMSGIVADGFYMISGEKNYFVGFDKICTEAKDARMELVKLTKQARKVAA